MPVTYEIDRVQRIIRTKCAGKVTLAEVVDHFHQLEREPGITGRLDVLLDLTETVSSPSANELRVVVAEIGRIRERVPFGALAIAANSDALYGMTRVFEVYAQDYFAASSVFRSLEQAEEWLLSQAAA
jgi:hypothetical protein